MSAAVTVSTANIGSTADVTSIASVIDNIDAALDTVNNTRATFGATQSRFEAIISNLQVAVENQSAARSRIMDADYAAETAALSRAQILQQAGNAMVAQANQLPQQVLRLLARIAPASRLKPAQVSPAASDQPSSGVGHALKPGRKITMATISRRSASAAGSMPTASSTLLRSSASRSNCCRPRPSTIDAKLSSFGKIQSYLDSMRTAATKLKTGSTWTATGATSSNTAAVTVTSSSGTSPGSYSVNVTQLASAQMTASPGVASATTTVGQGTLRIQLGAWNTAVDDFTEKAGSSAVDITIGPGEDTLEGIRDKINGTADLGVKASIVNDASGSRLVLQSSTTGETNGFRVQVVGDATSTTKTPQACPRLAFDPETFGHRRAPGRRRRRTRRRPSTTCRSSRRPTHWTTSSTASR
jgi:hypothetical protein